jgi:hypothetical protein
MRYGRALIRWLSLFQRIPTDQERCSKKVLKI